MEHPDKSHLHRPVERHMHTSSTGETASSPQQNELSPPFPLPARPKPSEAAQPGRYGWSLPVGAAERPTGASRRQREVGGGKPRGRRTGLARRHSTHNNYVDMSLQPAATGCTRRLPPFSPTHPHRQTNWHAAIRNAHGSKKALVRTNKNDRISMRCEEKSRDVSGGAMWTPHRQTSHRRQW